MRNFDDVKDEIISISEKLVEMNLIEYEGGNISVRVGDEILISRRGSNKAVPTHDDIVRTGLQGDDEGSFLASSALEIHREIYSRTDAQAIIHAHPPLVTTLSLFLDSIEPIDENGVLYLGKQMPVVAAPVLFGWNLVATELAEALIDNVVAVLKWHGTFAKATDLSHALHRTRAAQVACGHIIRAAQLRPFLGEPTPTPEERAEFLGGTETRGLGRVDVVTA